MTTGFFWDERCFWHGGGNYALTLPVGGLVQPLAAGGLPENPETKRRLKNLMRRDRPDPRLDDAQRRSGHAATTCCACIPASYPRRSSSSVGCRRRRTGPAHPLRPRRLRDRGAVGGPGQRGALCAVLRGELDNAYALSRPPGHHCLPDWPNGFCLLGQYRHRDRGRAGRRAWRRASPWSTGTCTTATAPRRSSMTATMC